MPRSSIRLSATQQLFLPRRPTVTTTTTIRVIAPSYTNFSRAISSSAFRTHPPTRTLIRNNLSVHPAPRLLERQQHTPAKNMAATISVEDAKRAAAVRAVEDHFDPSARYVGIGSGTTIVYVVEAIKQRSTNNNIQFVPTGYQSRQVIVEAGLVPIAFDSLPDGEVLDVAFDGADEVDDELNCIKGGGACLFQEKLVAERAKKFVCVADYRKAQSRLLTNWPTIPIEVAPLAVHTVARALRVLGSPAPVVRSHTLAKTGPVKTDQDFFIIDAPFPPLLTPADVTAAAGAVGIGQDGVWEVERLSREIKRITGVLEVGIFCGDDGVKARARGATGGQKPVACYFGMQDGSVMVRHAKTKAV